MPELSSAARPFLHLRIAALIAGTATAVVVARALGPEARGSLAILIFLALAAASFLGLGSPLGLYDAVRRGVRPVRAVRIAIVIGSGCAAVTAALWPLIHPVVERIVELGPIVLAIPVGVAAGSLIISQASSMIVLATGRNQAAAFIQVFQPAAALLLYTSSFLAFGFRVESAAVAYAASCACAAIAGFVASLHHGRLEQHSTDLPIRRSTRAIVGSGLRAMPGDAMNLLSYRLDVLVVGWLAGAASLGTYAVAVQFLEPLWVAASALAMGLMGMARHGAAQDVHMILSAARSSSVLCLVGSASLTFVIWAIGTSLLGQGYETLPVVMLALIPGITALAISKVVAASVIARGSLGKSSIVATVTVVLNTGLNLVLVPLWAEVGAALASSLSYVVSAVIWLQVLRRQGGAVPWRELLPKRSDLLLLRRLVQVRGTSP